MKKDEFVESFIKVIAYIIQKLTYVKVKVDDS